MARKTEPLFARCDQRTRSAAEHAAEVEQSSLSEFIRRAVRERAMRVLTGEDEEGAHDG